MRPAAIGERRLRSGAGRPLRSVRPGKAWRSCEEPRPSCRVPLSWFVYMQGPTHGFLMQIRHMSDSPERGFGLYAKAGRADAQLPSLSLFRRSLSPEHNRLPDSALLLASCRRSFTRSIKNAAYIHHFSAIRVNQPNMLQKSIIFGDLSLKNRPNRRNDGFLQYLYV